MDTYALHDAVRLGLIDELNDLLDTKPDIHATLPSGRTALHLAAAAKRPDLICALLFAGCDVHAPDCFGRTPLDVDRIVRRG